MLDLSFTHLISLAVAVGIGVGAGATGKASGLGNFFKRGNGTEQNQNLNVEIGQTGAAAQTCQDCIRNLKDLLPCKDHGEVAAKIAFGAQQNAAIWEKVDALEGKMDAGFADNNRGLRAIIVAMVKRGFDINLPE